MEALPDGPKNPYGNGFIPVETELTSEAQAQRVCDPMRARLWKVKNPESLHPVTGAFPALAQVLGCHSLPDRHAGRRFVWTTGCHESAYGNQGMLWDVLH